ncbi:Hypothetical predicted protein [Octopus vulgaris]|uniref:Uncharacterized protein n=1 Tax=Octopus vulgaris TaxID=6645 RepID=A0AA36B5R3_OCTVU|nr:Hypothetical predicted protein [Octopus vulgaris]
MLHRIPPINNTTFTTTTATTIITVCEDLRHFQKEIKTGLIRRYRCHTSYNFFYELHLFAAQIKASLPKF